MIYHETEHGTIYCGDSLDVLSGMADESVDCCITSPPYWGLRDYGTAEWEGGDAECEHKVGRFEYAVNEKQASNNGSAGHQAKDICPKCGAIRKDKQLGLEKTPEEYVANMVQLFREVRRVLKKDGTLWLNLGDSYAMSSMRGKNSSFNGAVDQSKQGIVGINKSIPIGLKPKDLVGIPWRVAFALQADGWWLRQDIIWHKPNPMPESVRDRCTKSHEYIFMLTKSARYYFDSEAIKENRESVCTRKRTSAFRQQNELPDQTLTTIGRNKRSVWTVTTKPYKEAHFATYPPDLILPCVKAARPDAVILDPFFGSGTTGLVAIQNGRQYIGIDLNPDYCAIAAKRIDNELQQITISLES